MALLIVEDLEVFTTAQGVVNPAPTHKSSVVSGAGNQNGLLL